MSDNKFNADEERRKAERREGKERTLISRQSRVQESGTGLIQLVRLQRDQRSRG